MDEAAAKLNLINYKKFEWRNGGDDTLPTIKVSPTHAATNTEDKLKSTKIKTGHKSEIVFGRHSVKCFLTNAGSLLILLYYLI